MSITLNVLRISRDFLIFQLHVRSSPARCTMEASDWGGSDSPRGDHCAGTQGSPVGGRCSRLIDVDRELRATDHLPPGARLQAGATRSTIGHTGLCAATGAASDLCSFARHAAPRCRARFGQPAFFTPMVRRSPTWLAL